MKTIEENFRDWEGDVFGYGYGTGELHTIPALKKFMDAVPRKGCYDYEVVENKCGPAQTWFIINILCRASIIEYGTSPRVGWLTDEGQKLKSFISSRTNDELVEICTCYNEEYTHCYPDVCNCGAQGYEEGLRCSNPFWNGKP